VNIVRNVKKPNDYHGTHMRVLQWMKNVSYYLWPKWGYCKECKMSVAIMGLICGYCKDAICQRLLWDLYVGTVRMQNASGYYGTYMQVLQWMQNASGYFRTYMQVLHIWKWPYGVYNRKWCRYYLKCVYCFKVFRWCESYYIRCKYCTMLFWSLVWFLHLKY